VAILKDASQRDLFIEQLKQKGILCMAFGPGMIRMVTHLDITAADCAFCIETLQNM
jgi:4-aminobutyrate aminotransferase-like enzyme